MTLLEEGGFGIDILASMPIPVYRSQN